MSQLVVPDCFEPREKIMAGGVAPAKKVRLLVTGCG